MIQELLEISPLKHELLQQQDIQVDMLRLDKLHPFISGNKWFKLKYNLKEAKEGGYKTILSFGGTYSNHLHALAYAGEQVGFQTIGIVRGEAVGNTTLHDCKQWGMQLEFISRTDYQNKHKAEFLQQLKAQYPSAYIIPEGGSNELGLKGCEDILSSVDHSLYTHIACSVGTGTTLSGLINSSFNHQTVIGFSAIKNGSYLAEEIKTKTNHRHFMMMHDYHFGGFAKSNSVLEQFMQDFNKEQQIILDRVYTAKMMYGLFKEIEQERFKSGSRILAVHTGGLQGNRS